MVETLTLGKSFAHDTQALKRGQYQKRMLILRGFLDIIYPPSQKTTGMFVDESKKKQANCYGAMAPQISGG
jgi:hypothetical protein